MSLDINGFPFQSSDDSPIDSPESSFTTPEDQDFYTNIGDLRDIQTLLIQTAKAAGEIMKAAEPGVASAEAKRNTSDMVTETDKAIEVMVHRRLSEAYPNILFLGEESFQHGEGGLTNDPTFVCDPIDGTLNFIHGFPNSAVSIALTANKEPIVGVVYNVFRGDIYTAIKGCGAFLINNTDDIFHLPIRQPYPALTGLNDCLVGIEWGSQREGVNWDLRTSMAKTLMSSKAPGGAMVHSIRSCGSAALAFCYVAAGHIDLFWEGGCWIWDVCAGWIILKEAGGLVASANPGNWNPDLEGRLYLAVRGAKKEDQKQVVEELWSYMGDRKFVF